MRQAEPNVTLKISGLGIRRERWSAGRNAAIVRDAIRIFGADRNEILQWALQQSPEYAWIALSSAGLEG